MDYALYLLMVLSVAGFSYEAAYSDLANSVKGFIKIDQPQKYNALLYITTWRKALGNYYLVLFPFILLLILFRVVHNYVQKLFTCPFCQSVWYMFAINFFYLKLSLLSSIILSCVAIPVVALIDRLRT